MNRESFATLLYDGSVILINEVDFGDTGNKAIYETAADFTDSINANRFLQIYHQSGFDPADFLQLYIDVYMERAQGGAQTGGKQNTITPGNGSGNGVDASGKGNGANASINDNAGAQGNGLNVFSQLPFDAQDVAPSGSLDLSGESLDSINALRAQSGLPPIEGGDWVYSDDSLAHGDESDIMDSADAQEEAGSGADGADGQNRQTTEGVWETITGLKYKPSSGAVLKATPGKTTTILGSYYKDMRSIIGELGNVKSTDFGPRNGGFNVLNVPDDIYRKLKSEQFWEKYNMRWLDSAIQRGDDIVLATMPEEDYLSYIDNGTGEEMITSFGREYSYLVDHGYVYDAASHRMILK